MAVMGDRKCGPHAVMVDLIYKRSSVAGRQTCANGHQVPHMVGFPLRLRMARRRDQSVFRSCLPAALVTRSTNPELINCPIARRQVLSEISAVAQIRVTLMLTWFSGPRVATGSGKQTLVHP